MPPEGDESVTGFTQCPSCRTIFRVQSAFIRGKGGRARCGLCGHVFNAVSRWRTDLPPPRAAPPASDGANPSAAPSDEPSPRRPKPDARRASQPAEAALDERATQSGTETERGEPAASGAAVEPADAAAEPTTEAVRAPPWEGVAARELETAAPVRRWPWLAAVGALVIVLVGQVGWFHREQLARREALRPWLARACSVLPCELAAPRRPEAIAVVERALSRHAQRSGALLLNATISNTADAPQPWPQLGLRLSALNGDRIAEHWFAASDYRVNERSDGQGDGLMRPGKHYAVRLAVSQPEREVAGFELAFR